MTMKTAALWLCSLVALSGVACVTTPVVPADKQLASSIPSHELVRFCKQLCNEEMQNNYRISMGTLRSAYPYTALFRERAVDFQKSLDTGHMSDQFRKHSYTDGKNVVTRIEQTIICVNAAHDENQFYIDNAPDCTVQKVCSSLSLIDPLNLGVGCGMN